MSMAITYGGHVATHYLEVRGKSDKDISREKLSEFAYEKMKEINISWSPDIELIYVKDKLVKVGVFVSMTCSNDVVLDSAKEWVKNHLLNKVPGIVLDSLMIKTVFDMGLSTPFKEEVIKI
jgi:hypothetical protein